jgi:beta-glucosidase
MYYTFPDDFIWGVATASAQIEGAAFEDGKGLSIWDVFSKRHGAIKNADTPTFACDHYNRLDEDLDLLKKLGVDSYRFSISWPRIFPKGTGEINSKGLDFYERLIDGLIKRNITPFVTLYHWDLPQALEDKGGWRIRETALAFSDYAETVISKFGDRVKNWITFNEVPCFVELGYRQAAHAPGAEENEKTIRQIYHHVMLAHGLCVKAVRRCGGPGAKVGLVHNFHVVAPFTDEVPDIEKARQCFIDKNSWMLDALFKGVYPEDKVIKLGSDIPDVAQGDMQIISEAVDFLGINIYGIQSLIHREYGSLEYEKYFPRTDMDWPINPDCLYWGSRFINDMYNPPEMYITENGCAYPDDINKKGRVDDLARIEYLRSHLIGLHRAVSEGIPVKGYFCWSFLDNFEWSLGYSKRFGIVHVNYENYKRIPKLSFEWYARLIKNKGI